MATSLIKAKGATLDVAPTTTRSELVGNTDQRLMSFAIAAIGTEVAVAIFNPGPDIGRDRIFCASADQPAIAIVTASCYTASLLDLRPHAAVGIVVQ